MTGAAYVDELRVREHFLDVRMIGFPGKNTRKLRDGKTATAPYCIKSEAPPPKNKTGPSNFASPTSGKPAMCLWKLETRAGMFKRQP